MNNVDKELIRKRFAKHLAAYDSLAVVQRQIAATLAEAFSTHAPARIDRALEVGCGTGFLTREILKISDIETLYLNDLVPEALPALAGRLALRPVELLPGDAEQIELPMGLDAIVSASTVQWFNDLPVFFEKAAAALKPGGLLAFNTFGPENLHQIKSLTGNGLEYLSEGELRKSVEKHFAVAAWRRQTIRQTFTAPFDVLRHLRQTGVTGTGTFRWIAGTLRVFEREYARRYSMEDRVFLDWDVIFVVAKLPG